MRFFTILLVSVSLSGAEAPVQTATTREGVLFGWVGEKPKAPAPTVFILGGAIEDELTGQLPAEAAELLGRGVLKVSLDLPGHGRDVRVGEAPSMRAWRSRLSQGEDVTGEFARRATAVLNCLVERKFADPAKVAVLGGSRGGFMAFHFAAAGPRVRSIVAMSPVTDLLALREFLEIENPQPARAAAANRLADRLCVRAMWISIGSTDERVSTMRVIEFTSRVLEAAGARGIAPLIELHVQPADGHTTPAGAYAAAAAWLLKQWR